jgi:alpha-galactosidase
MRGRRPLPIVTLVLSVLLAGIVVTPVSNAAPVVAAQDSTLARTPPMGFNNWNAFGCDVSETLIKQTADVIVSSGLKDLGYQYVNIDDCWSLRERGRDGRLVPDPVKFPSGIRGVADYVHAKGLKLGIYGDAGTRTCAGFPGSLGLEDLDAQTWADWGVDYLKYDNCNNQSDGSQADFIRRYTAMRRALDRTGRPIVYAVCEWGQSQPWLWATGVGHLWRTTGDISDNWASLRSIIARNAPLYPYAGPGHWNDPDMMEIGNGGMTATEYRTHMSMWAMMAAPLLIGTDLRSASPETMAILSNREIIAIDQDRLGVQGAVVADRDGLMVLDKPLANGDRAIALYNSTDSLATVSIPVHQTGLARARAYRLQDVWTGAVRQAGSTIAAAVPAHGTVVYRVRPVANPASVEPIVPVGASLGTLVPRPAGDGTLTTTVTNHGDGSIRWVGVDVAAPEGWTVTPATPTRRTRLGTGDVLETTWTVGVPQGTPAGRYPITITAAYDWGRGHWPGTSTSVLVSTVVTAPPDGRRHLSTVLAVDSANARGPAELDQSNGGEDVTDGALITIAGRHYTRGIGTTAPSELRYYLGGRCSRLVTDVGVDDESTTTVPAGFTVYADDTVAASTDGMRSGDPARTLTADLTGAHWLRLVTTGSAAGGDGTTINDHTDWAAPVLTCGDVSPADPVQPVEQTLYSFETGTEDFTIVNVGDGGTLAQSTAFHTDGGHGLEVFPPAPGNWFGRVLPEPLDLTGRTTLKFDLAMGPASGGVGEIAIQIGDAFTWCQGGRWAWANPGSTRTIVQKFSELGCSGGIPMDTSKIRAIWAYVNGPHGYIDNVRTE